MHENVAGPAYCSLRRPSIKVKMKDEPTTTPKRSQAYLSHEQVERLLDVMNEEIDVHGRGNFPTIHLTLSALIKRVQHRLGERDMKVSRVKMNGGAASYILASRELPYTDIDLIFGGVDLSESKNFEVVKDAVLEALIDFLPPCTNKSKITPSAMKAAYVKKMVKVCDGDMWSLISLNNDLGRFIELKFVHRMRRQFEFSVDSFQLHLDSVLTSEDEESDESQEPDFVSNNEESSSDSNTNGEQKHSSNTVPSTPLVLAESVYGDFRSALRHLNKMLIDTTEPELIRGGGLLKYCQLLARGYRPARAGQCRSLEPYMCSRFFIDFPTVVEQQKKLKAYMDNHFRGDTRAKHDYLLLLYRVVDESTVCLMNHDRRLTLSMINSMAGEMNARMYYEEQRRRALMAAKVLSVHASSGSNSTRSTTPTTCTSTVTANGDRRESTENESYLGEWSAAAKVGGEQPTANIEATTAAAEESRRQRPKQTLLYVPPNASYWIKVV